MSQILKTLRQIAYSDSVGVVEGVLRHSQWQFRRLLQRFPCELPISESRLYVDQHGGVAALVNAMGEYDFNNMRLLRLILSRGENTFFDVGANIGSYTLVASESRDARVVSLEPHPSTFLTLKQNVQRNARNNVLCLNLALSDEDGYLSLTDLPESSLNRVQKNCTGGTHNLRVISRRFDGLCRELRLYPDFIKIDVEGYEGKVLEGFGDLIGASKIVLIEGGEREDVRSLLQSAGYDGPWFCHFRQGCFSKKQQARPEDPVYLGTEFANDLRKFNFAIS